MVFETIRASARSSLPTRRSATSLRGLDLHYRLEPCSIGRRALAINDFINARRQIITIMAIAAEMNKVRQ
jgi:hypothetical protein